MATIKGLFALSALIALGACATSKQDLDRAYSKGINDGRSMAGGQMTPGYPGAQMSSGYAQGGPMVQPMNGPRLWPAGMRITHGNCSGVDLHFEPSLKGNPQEFAIVDSVRKYLCSPTATASGQVAGFTFTATPNGR